MGKKVLVIGGGIAGLSAASTLLSDGHLVTLLEARSRFGGRIDSMRDRKCLIELGADFSTAKAKVCMSLSSEPLADTVYFAGEVTVTDGQTGTVFGAFETGARAAREIMGQ
jgi:monoamine oxidase